MWAGQSHGLSQQEDRKALLRCQTLLAQSLQGLGLGGLGGVPRAIDKRAKHREKEGNGPSLSPKSEPREAIQSLGAAEAQLLRLRGTAPAFISTVTSEVKSCRLGPTRLQALLRSFRHRDHGVVMGGGEWQGGAEVTERRGFTSLLSSSSSSLIILILIPKYFTSRAKTRRLQTQHIEN